MLTSRKAAWGMLRWSRVIALYLVCICLGTGAFFLPTTVFASQNIIIDRDLGLDVYGNGEPPDGSLERSDPSTLKAPNNNSVLIEKGATVTGEVYGAYGLGDSGSLEVTNNKVAIYDGSVVEYDVYGACAYNDYGNVDVLGNTVMVFNSTAGSLVYGGYISQYGDSGESTASGNSVTILGSSISNDVYGGKIYSDAGSAVLSNNQVTSSSSSEIVGHVFGGKAESTIDLAIASNNRALIFDTVVEGKIYGGQSISSTNDATASNNEVVVINSMVTHGIYGGFADSDGDDKYGIASHNNIYIGESTVNGKVIGGYSLVDYAETGFATHNTITISGNCTLYSASLYGGLIDNFNDPSAPMDAFTGNTLNVWEFRGLNLRRLVGFEFINFALLIADVGDTPVLGVSDVAALHEFAAPHRSSQITVSTFGDNGPLPLNTKLTLIEVEQLEADQFTQTTAQGLHGVTLRYTWALQANTHSFDDADTLTASLIRVVADPQIRPLSEGFIAGAALVEQGADLLVGQGLGRAIQAGQAVGQSGFSAFGAFSTHKQRYATGSHLDLSGLSLLAGLSRGLNLSAGRLTLGAFIEYGKGKYDTFNAFNDIFNNPVEAKGSGTLNRFGGGLLGQLDFASQGAGHAYLEAGLRIGQLSNEFSSLDFIDYAGPIDLGYASKSAYFGLHLGAGYVLKLGNSANLDLYAKYFWTRLAGDQVTLPNDDVVDFAAINTHRVRAGLRLNYLASQLLSPYAGLAVDYTFGGKAKATTYGFAIDAPSLAGATGLAELGLSLRPVQNLSLDLGVQGYVGARKGISGSLQLRFAF